MRLSTVGVTDATAAVANDDDDDSRQIYSYYIIIAKVKSQITQLNAEYSLTQIKN